MLNAEAWVRTANELTAAMKLLEPHVKRFWKRKTNMRPKQSLIQARLRLGIAAVGQRRGRDQLMRKKSDEKFVVTQEQLNALVKQTMQEAQSRPLGELDILTLKTSYKLRKASFHGLKRRLRCIARTKKP